MLSVRGRRAQANLVRTIAVLAVLALGFVVAGSLVGPVGAWVALAAAGGLGVYVWKRCDTGAIRAMRAYPVSEAEQPQLCRIVKEMTVRARVPMPRVYVSPTPAVNALAAGRDPNHASLCVTEGALDRLDERELRAVVGHEIAHIRSRDTVPAGAAGALIRVAVTVPLAGVVVAVLARLAFGGTREFDADRESARLVGEPLALASALRKLDAAARELVLPAEPGVIAASHLMITNPLRPTGLWRLVRAHPPTAERIARLEQLAGYRR